MMWLMRLPFIGFAVASNLSRTVTTINVFDTRTMTWIGEICAAELALTHWTASTQPGAPTRPLWVAGLVLLAASSTPDDTFMIVIAPAFFAALLVAMRWSVIPRQEAPFAAGPMPWRYAVVLAAVLLCGGGISALLTAQRSAISQWGMQFLGERLRIETGSLSMSPMLSSTFGNRGSLNRALRIDGEGDFLHLRGAAFTIYGGGGWAPRAADREGEEALSTDLEPHVRGASAHVTRLLNNRGIVFAPLDCMGLHFPDVAPLYRVRFRGDVIKVDAFAPSRYDISVSPDPDHQGPLCIPPAATEKPGLLNVPKEIDPRVRLLAAKITAAAPTPKARVEAIRVYLLANYKYSLSVQIGRGDPLSFLLLDRKMGDCQFFGSAVVILARIAGVPSRFVVGYSGHEHDGDHVIIVRQRDAHAWAECWIEGTGWITVDATPGPGQPMALSESPSPLKKLSERFEDALNDLKTRIQQGTLVKPAILLLGVIVLVLAVREIWRRRGLVNRKVEPSQYAVRDLELAQLFRTFEFKCRSLGLDCPAARTWLEHIFAAERGEVASVTSAADVKSIMSFLAAYNAVRFGAAGEDLEELRRRLELIRDGQAGSNKTHNLTRRSP